MKIPDTLSVKAARILLRRRRRDSGGVYCPACDRVTKEYHRSINAEQARSLIIIAQTVEVGERFHLRDVLRHGAVSGGSKHAAALRWWGLLEAVDDARGWWTLTEDGRRFALGRKAVPKYVWEYDGEPVEFDGPLVTVHDALGNKFNFDDLWSSQ